MSLTPLTPRVHIDVFSHGFRVHRYDDHVRQLCYQFCLNFVERKFVMIGRGRMEQKIAKVYAAATAQRDQYFFHIGHLDRFLAHLHNHHIARAVTVITEVPMYEPAPVTFDWMDEERKPRDFQIKIIEFFLKLLPRRKVATLQTGKGKTFTTLATIHAAGARTIILLGAKYMEQWTKDAVKTFGLKKGEIYTVTGSKALKTIIAMAQEDEEFQEKVKLIIISQDTYRNYLLSYFANPDGDVGYRIPPWEFFGTFRAMFRVIDEVHLNFHLNWIIDCVSHVFKSISLSATLVSDDLFKNQLYDTMFPPDSHAPTPAFDKYIDIYSVPYRIRDNHLIKFLNGFRQYHQATYEKSIMRRPKLWEAYVQMVVKIVEFQFYQHPDYRPGMKCAIFCGMKEMVEAVVKALKAKYPDKKVRRYVDVDTDEALYDGELIVTTLQSCGTGKDIPDLAVCVSTIALSNKQANEQLIGRLRVLKNFPGITPRFVFLFNYENPKHALYQRHRKQKLDGKIRNFNELVSDLVL